VSIIVVRRLTASSDFPTRSNRSQCIFQVLLCGNHAFSERYIDYTMGCNNVSFRVSDSPALEIQNVGY